MPDYPRTAIAPEWVSSLSRFSQLVSARNLVSSSFAAYNWPAANQAIYMPFRITFPFVVRRVGWANGTTITSSSMDMGIYTRDGSKIYSTGSTTMSGAGGSQYVSPTAFMLDPGEYLFALACNNTTARGFGLSTVSAVHGIHMGCLQQASAFALPSTATFAAWNSVGYPLCAITST